MAVSDAAGGTTNNIAHLRVLLTCAEDGVCGQCLPRQHCSYPWPGIEPATMSTAGQRVANLVTAVGERWILVNT